MDYNVLWLDDHFGIAGDSMETMYSNFLSSQKNGRYTSFHIDRCTTSDEMKAMLNQNECRYQAAILDVFGKVNDEDSKDSARPFFEIMEYLRSKNLIVKIFSGELEDVSNRTVVDYIESHGLEPEKDYFTKALGYQKLFKTLETELEAKLSLYKQYPELLDLFRKGYLPKTAKDLADKFLDDYSHHDKNALDKNYFRELYLIILEQLVDDGLVDDNHIGGSELFGKLFNILSYGGKFNKESKCYEGMNVPDEICPRPVKYAAQFLGQMSRDFHHATKNGQSIFAPAYYETLMDGVYSSMMILLRWFYSYCESRDGE